MLEKKLPMTAVILAGGQSSRMKINKAFLKIGEKTLLKRSLEVLDLIFDEVIISANDIEIYEGFNKKIVPDLIKNQGPLGGLHASLIAANYDKVFFVACDMPFLNEEVIHYLALKTKEYDIVVPSIEGRIHPLHGFYSKKCLDQIQYNLDRGKRKLLTLYEDSKVYFAGRAELEVFGDIDKTLTNINTPEEWLSATSSIL